MQHGETLIERVALLGPREWCIAAGVFALAGAVAWIGRNVGRLIETLDALNGRVRRCEDGAACLDGEMRDARAALHSRCDRLQSIVEGRSWRDSRLETRDMTRTGAVTMIDLKKPNG